MRTDLMTMSVVAIFTLALIGCDQGTGPTEGEAEVTVQAVGDGESSGVNESVSPNEEAGSEGQGSIRFRASVHARLNTGEWVELTRRGGEEVRVQAMGGAHAAVLTSARLRAGIYDRIRVEFEEVEARDVSIQLRLGGLLRGSVRVQGDGGLAGRVEKPTSWTVRAGGEQRILVDLNSSAWLDSADAESRVVSRAEFENAVQIRAE